MYEFVAMYVYNQYLNKDDRRFIILPISILIKFLHFLFRILGNVSTCICILIVLMKGINISDNDLLVMRLIIIDEQFGASIVRKCKIR